MYKNRTGRSPERYEKAILVPPQYTIYNTALQDLRYSTEISGLNSAYYKFTYRYPSCLLSIRNIKKIRERVVQNFILTPHAEFYDKICINISALNKNDP